MQATQMSSVAACHDQFVQQCSAFVQKHRNRVRMTVDVTLTGKNWPNGQSDREATTWERMCNMMTENDIWLTVNLL